MIPQPAVPPRIAAAAASGVSKLIGKCGGDAERIMKAAHLQPADLADPSRRLALHHYCDLFEIAARHTGAGDFGLRFGLQYRTEEMGPLGALILASPDLGTALRNLCLYFPALQDHSCLRLREDAGLMALEYQITDGRIAQRRQDAELTLAIFAGIFRRCLGSGWAPAEVQFEHLRPAEAMAAESAFGAPVYYGAPRNALLFPRAALRTPMPGANIARLPVLQTALGEMAAAAGPEDFIGRVLSQIRAGFAKGEAGIDDVAARLGLSRTGLYRRLAREGEDFSELTRRVRCDLAKFYAAQPGISFTEVALLLGYSELSAFSRAFTRWTGQSPARYRQACRHHHPA